MVNILSKLEYNFYTFLGVFIKWIKNFEEFLKYYCYILAFEDSKSIYIRTTIAVILARRGKYEKAIKRYDKLIKEDPYYIRSWLGKSNSLLMLGKYDEALASINRALAINKDVIMLLALKANIFSIMMDADKELECAEYILSIDPDSKEGLKYKYRALQDLGEKDLAFKVCKELLDKHPKDDEVWYDLGNFELRNDNLRKALDCAEKAVDINNDVYNRSFCAYLLYENECYEESLYIIMFNLREWDISLYKRMYSYYLTGLCLNKLNRLDEASEYYNLGLKVEIDTFVQGLEIACYYMRARIFEELDNVEESIKNYEIVLNLNPDCNKAKDRMANLKSKT